MEETAGQEFPRSGSNASGVEVAYSVEARIGDGMDPREIAGQLFDNKWRLVEYGKAPIGVPGNSPLHTYAIQLRLLSYQAAQALRWWLHAEAEANPMKSSIGLESRILKHEIRYSWTDQVVSAHELIHGADRSNYMPDWGKKRD